jgi:hypothetical protein
MNQRYIPEVHDPIISELVTRWKRTDYQIADEMGFSISTIRTNRIRLGLEATPRPYVTTWVKEPPAKPEKPNPLSVAIATLGNRLVEKTSGYWLDHRPVNLHAIIREANVERVKKGLKQIPGHSSWQAPD